MCFTIDTETSMIKKQRNDYAYSLFLGLLASLTNVAFSS